MKKLCVLLAVLLIFPLSASATEQAELYPCDFAFEEFWYKDAKPAVEFIPEENARGMALMEAETGRVLFAKNENARVPIASVTKIMSTLLVMEAIANKKIAITDTVTVSEHASSMGGSQVYLEPGEQMSVDELLKALIIVSANDATVALAEHVCGSEQSFVSAMNEKCKELGMENTLFSNTNGLPGEEHYSSALDVALMTRELMKHELVFNYTTTWIDTIRNGTFGLANTNKLIRFYKGASGMKTGWTEESAYCLSGTAERDGMRLIAVVLGADSSSSRFAAAKNMLDFGYANYTLIKPASVDIKPLKVNYGRESEIPLEYKNVYVLSEKGAGDELEQSVTVNQSIDAPFAKGTPVGFISYTSGGKEVARAEIVTAAAVERMDYRNALLSLLSMIFSITA